MDMFHAIATNDPTPTTDAVTAELKKLKDSIGEVVGSVFYGTLLRTMRDSDLQGKYGHGGRGEEVFGAQLDALFAGNAGKATDTGLADSLYKHMEKQQKAMSEINQTIKDATGHDRA